MEPSEFFEKLKQNPRPVVVDFWAPWCGPCRAVKPALKKLSGQYAGRVDLWEVNADDNPELLRQLKIYGIPTLIGYQKDEEQVRYVGAKPPGQLASLFEALANGEVPARKGLSSWDRFFRLVAGILLAGAGWSIYSSWFLLVIGGLVMFSAVYDRCPIWKAITSQFKKAMAR